MDGCKQEQRYDCACFVILQLMDRLVASGRVRCVTTYGSQGAASYVPELARARGLKVIQGVWLDTDDGANRIQTDGTSFLAKTFPDVIVGVICGSEVRKRHGSAVATPIITGCIDRLRASGVLQPITHQATWREW